MTEQVAESVDQLAINTIRFLAVDMVEKAQSGHPGTPMALAPVAYLLWTRHLRFDPAAPDWPDRDRFVLSCGHASALLYSLLHLSGFDMPLEELQQFRQWGSKTPGHPEHLLMPGIETTTGPLGQGLSNAVGMAIARELLASRFNRPDFSLFDHRIWVLASDGDMMEGVASEASSLAGHLQLGSLKVFYDDNRITIDGPTSLAFSEDVGDRFAAYGWHVLRVGDGNDLEALEEALAAAEAETERPTLVVMRTHIAYGSPNKQDTAEAHGSPLGADEVELTKESLGWPQEPVFHVPQEAPAAFGPARERGRAERQAWYKLLEEYRSAHPQIAAELHQRLAGELPAGWQEALPGFDAEEGPLATRKASGKVLNAICQHLPQLVGGSADLTPSNNTFLEGEENFSATARGGRNLRFGVREHAMGAILSGMALSGLLIPYGGTFLIFSDYMRASIRLAALMEVPVIYVFTHDSIFLGEDGPTHQPISQLMGLRAIPGLTVIRPGDAWETVEAWRQAILNREGPTALALTRQKLPILAETRQRARDGVARGAYVLADPEGEKPRALLLATGSEVAPALEAHRRLAAEGIPTRMVSMPCWELFDAQPQPYRDEVLPPAVTKRLAIEAGVSLGWHKWVGPDGDFLSVERFGASAPYKVIAENYGFTPEEIVRRVKGMLERA